MKIISHRGNIRGPISTKENRPSYIDCAIGSGYDVEIDVRSSEGSLWLGHDEAQYRIDHNWIEKRKAYLWLHCKDYESALECQKYQSFCHSADPFIFTTTGHIWMHVPHFTPEEGSVEPPYKTARIDQNVIIPLLEETRIVDFKQSDAYTSGQTPYGICTDYPASLVNFYG